MGIKSCKGCEERAPGCHQYCKKYKQEKRELELEKEHLRKFDDPEYNSKHERNYRRYLKRKVDW